MFIMVLDQLSEHTPVACTLLTLCTVMAGFSLLTL